MLVGKYTTASDKTQARSTQPNCGQQELKRSRRREYQFEAREGTDGITPSKEIRRAQAQGESKDKEE